MKPTKITLEVVAKVIRLRVDAPDTLKGYSIIEASPISSGAVPQVNTISTMKKHGEKYAKRFAIPFVNALA